MGLWEAELSSASLLPLRKRPKALDVAQIGAWSLPNPGPHLQVAAESLDRFGLMKFRLRTTREITLDLFDAFAPRYNFWHTQAEVRSWFVQRGFGNIHVSGMQKHGFGMYGDKI